MTPTGKIFYIGFQRVGTKAFGHFMGLNGYSVASWDISSQNGWSAKFFDGRLNEILRSKSFAHFQVFEDGPWYHPGLVKFLYHELPDARFIFLTRPAEDWFRSMVTHSCGLTMGNAQYHCEAYDRLEDYNFVVNSLAPGRLPQLTIYDKPQHYMNVYRKKTLELTTFFARMGDAGARVFTGDLYDGQVYQKIADFLEIPNPLFLSSVEHKSQRTPQECVSVLAHALESVATQHSKRPHDDPATLAAEAAMVQRLLQLSPHNYSLYLRLANIRWFLGELDQAESVAREGLRRTPDCPQLQYLLAAVLERLGRLGEAACAARRAVALLGDNPAYVRLLERLQQHLTPETV